MARLFVARADKLSKIKVTRLRKLMNMGSRLRTPLEKKPTFEPSIRDKYVVSVLYFAPGNESHWPDAVFNLFNEQTKIHQADWYEIMEFVDQYDEWYEEYVRKDSLRTLIKNLESAAEYHGQRIANCANGFISGDDTAPYLYESGKLATEARKALYKALGLNK